MLGEVEHQLSLSPVVLTMGVQKVMSWPIAVYRQTHAGKMSAE
jgi:hypothetical protein